MCNERKNVDSWDTFFINVAISASKRSKDPRTQVGACIVSPDNRILSVGYNGTPKGFDDTIFPWSSSGNALDSKYGYVVHAELNAVLNYKGSLSDLKDSTVYVTLFPCNECAKALAQVGVKSIVYISDSHDGEDANIISKKILDTCGINYRKYIEGTWGNENTIFLNTNKVNTAIIKRTEQVLIDNGVEEADTVLQAIGYVLLNTELYPEEE